MRQEKNNWRGTVRMNAFCDDENEWVYILYRQGNSSTEIWEQINKWCTPPTLRTIQRIVKNRCYRDNITPRSQKEAFNNAIKRGRVQWKYKDIKIKRIYLDKKTRYGIMERDKFKCVLCGSDAKKALLEVDHITPICQGGKSTEDNLQTLCYECNRGKQLYRKER